MKLFALLATALLVAGAAEARDKMTKSLPEIVYDRTSSAVGDVVEAPGEIAEFARENDCVHGGSRSQCIYELPMKGLVAVGIDTTGDIVEQGALVITDVPVRIADWFTTQFETCVADSQYQVERVVCGGIATVFTWTANGIYWVGQASVFEINDFSGTAVQSVNMTSDAISYLFAGDLKNSVDNTISATLLSAGCLTIGKVGNLLLNGRNLNCKNWVAQEREKMRNAN